MINSSLLYNLWRIKEPVIRYQKLWRHRFLGPVGESEPKHSLQKDWQHSNNVTQIWVANATADTSVSAGTKWPKIEKCFFQVFLVLSNTMVVNYSTQRVAFRNHKIFKLASVLIHIATITTPTFWGSPLWYICKGKDVDAMTNVKYRNLNTMESPTRVLGSTINENIY